MNSLRKIPWINQHAGCRSAKHSEVDEQLYPIKSYFVITVTTSLNLRNNVMRHHSAVFWRHMHIGMHSGNLLKCTLILRRIQLNTSTCLCWYHNHIKLDTCLWYAAFMCSYVLAIEHYIALCYMQLQRHHIVKLCASRMWVFIYKVSNAW